MDADFLLVAFSNTVHLLSTVLWIGWSALLALLIAPRAAAAHAPGGWESALLRRGGAVAYGALAALGATGMLQMGAHPSYSGLFQVDSFWSRLLLIKHLLVIASTILIFYLGLAISPRLRLAMRRAAAGRDAEPATQLHRFRQLAWLNLLFGLGVLAITGMMTAMH